MGNRFPFGLPSGWYVVAAANEVARGQVVSRHYFGQDLVLYRGDDGVARIAEAFCPHMGADLGRVGSPAACQAAALGGARAERPDPDVVRRRPRGVGRRYVKQFYPPEVGGGDQQVVDEAVAQAAPRPEG